MTQTPDILPLAVDKQIDLACDRFERAWKSGQPLRIEEVLGTEQEPNRSALLRELLRVELELISRESGTWLPSAYRERFPDHVQLVDTILAEVAGLRAVTAQGSTVSLKQSPGDTASPSNNPAQPILPTLPAKFGRFEVIKVLGQGAMGTVYHARDLQLKRDVAIKVPRWGTIVDDEQVKRFLREAKAAATLRHPNICPVFEIIDEEQRYAIVMAFIVGKPLSAYIKGQRDKPISERQAANLVRKLAIALKAAHQKGIVHRDLKPDNIMIDQEHGEPVITDFGLARMSTADNLHLTLSGQIMGTPAYMPPEQARGATQQIGPASDIYSLGVIFYELLCGERPFKSSSVAEVFSDILWTQPAPPSVHRPSIDHRLESICMTAMAKKIEDRYKSMAELASALSEYLRAGSHQIPPPVLVQPPESQTPTAEPNELDTPFALSPVARVDSQPVEVPVRSSAKDESPKLGQFGARVKAMLVVPPKSLILDQRRRTRSPWPVVAALGTVAALFSGIVLYVATNNGTIKILLSDPAAQVVVKVDGEIVNIVGLDQSLRLQAGEHGLVVTGENFKTLSQSFTLTRGTEQELHVELEPKTATQPPLTAVTQPTITQQVLDRGSQSDNELKNIGVLAVATCDQELQSEAGLADPLKAVNDGDPRTEGLLWSHQLPATLTLTWSQPIRATIVKIWTRNSAFQDPIEEATIELLDAAGASVWSAPLRNVNSHRIAEFQLPTALKSFTKLQLKIVKGEPRPGISEIEVFDGEVATSVQLADSVAPSPLREVSPSAATFINATGMKFVRIEPGEFLMGQSPDEADHFTTSPYPADKSIIIEKGSNIDERQHKVRITKPFMMGVTEVTQSQWNAVMPSSPWAGVRRSPDGDNFPASSIPWSDAVQFCHRLSEEDGRTYRLPTEAEWEYCCRAGTTTVFAFGDDHRQLGEYAWERGHANDQPGIVGERRPNGWGLHDMHGNVWEWCSDWYAAYSGANETDPLGPANGERHTVRGGGYWSIYRSDYRSASRRPGHDGHPEYGFRVVMDLP